MSKKLDVDKLIQNLNDGIVPYEFTYDLTKKADFVDWSALYYDDWNTPAFWYAKQPPGLLEQFPCLFEWVDQIAEDRQGITPLMEIDYRIKKAKEEETLKKIEALSILHS